MLGDILATRLKVRGLRGVVVDGRVRDVRALKKLTGEGKEDAGFTLWNKGISTVGTGMEAQAWAWDVRIRIGGVDIDAVSFFFFPFSFAFSFAFNPLFFFFFFFFGVWGG